MKLLYAIPFLLILVSVPVFAEPYKQHVTFDQWVEDGKDYTQKLIGTKPNGNLIISWSTTPTRILDYVDGSGREHYVNYKLHEDSTNIKLETLNSGSLVFNKSTCSYTLYNNGFIDQSNPPAIQGISWTVKGKAAASTNWNSLSVINSSACNTQVTNTSDSVSITATKTASGLGTFQIVLSYSPGKGIKETMRAYNDNTLWNNHNIGFTEKFQVPKNVIFGNKTYDLSNYNGTVLDRNWIQSHQSKVIKFTDKSFYDFGIGFANLNDIKITWDGSKAFLSMNYLYPTGIVPYHQWFEVDPTFGFTTSTLWGPYSTTCTVGDADIGGGQARIGTVLSVTSCYEGIMQWNVTSVPTAINSVTNATLRYDILAPGSFGAGDACDWVLISGKPSTMTTAQQYGTVQSGILINSNDVQCKTPGLNYLKTLNSSANDNILTHVSSGGGYMAMGVRGHNNVGDNASQMSSIELQFIYEAIYPNPPTNFVCDPNGRHVDCTWTASSPTSGSSNSVTKHYLGRSLNNSTWPGGNKTQVGNVTSASIYDFFRINQLYYMNVTAGNLLNSTYADYTSFTTDNYPGAPTNQIATPTGDTRIKLNYDPPLSNGGDPVDQYRIDACNICTSWTTLSNNTITLNYNHTGLTSGQTWKYRIAAWNGVGLGPFTANLTAQTFVPTTGTIAVATGVIGDTLSANTTVSITAASPTPVTVSQIKLYRDGSLQDTQTTSVQIAVGSSSSNFDSFWNLISDASTHQYNIKATVSNSTGTVFITSSNFTGSREYDPSYAPALENPAIQGTVNYTVSRYDDQDGVLLHVNRLGVSTGQTWQIECISQTNSEAAATKNQSINWQGTWRNTTNTGYFNTTWTGVSGTHTYITCFNDARLFTTTSYTNSSLALFGIQLFDESYGSMLGVPVGIFFLAMAGSMANKRTAPTWIIVVLGMAGTMAAIGFFTLNPLVWGIALVAAICGVFVNQKVF